MIFDLLFAAVILSPIILFVLHLIEHIRTDAPPTAFRGRGQAPDMHEPWQDSFSN